MRVLLAVIPIVLLPAQLMAAPAAKPPYETTVETDDSYVRSGPGSRYYPTGKLKRGQRIVVHRHDPGGWYMIAPPPGSFSWIPAKYVQSAGDGKGTVSENNVAVRVGSFESDIRELFQRRLSQGDEVRILGEKMLPPEAGNGPNELWYRIEPPRGEWRWIMGQAVSPQPAAEGGSPSGDPFDRNSGGGSAKRSPPIPKADDSDDASDFEKPAEVGVQRQYVDDNSVERGELKGGPMVRQQEKPTVDSRRTRRRQAAQFDELDLLDKRFRSILDKPPLDWEFSQLEQDYRALQEEAEVAGLRQMITARLVQIDGYRRTRSEHEELARLSDETLRRDAELAAAQRLHESHIIQLRQPRFDGVGIVDRASLNRPGAPQHALMAPNGRVLAYLVPAAGVNLDAWIGRAAGVMGSRVHHPDLKADLITVTRLQGVRLAP